MIKKQKSALTRVEPEYISSTGVEPEYMSSTSPRFITGARLQFLLILQCNLYILYFQCIIYKKKKKKLGPKIGEA
jgi:hypothetical protein